MADYMLLPLSRGQFAKVSPEDWTWANQFKWFANPTIWGKFYARRNQRIAGKRVKVYLHRELMKPGPGLEVDHINRDTLDCRRENLRCVTRRQNQMNIGKRRSNTSGYKGVHYDRIENRWIARARIEGKSACLGRFRSAEAAYSAYCAAVTANHGEFANLQ